MAESLIISPTGQITGLYTEALDLGALGSLTIERASHVEPDDQGRWFADVIAGPRLGPFAKRSQALEAEAAWLREHRL